MFINDLGEFEFIDRIKSRCINREEGVLAGIGDDCAVFRASANRAILLSTDMLIEGIHFRRDEIPPILLGRKSLAVSISDIAAMGGRPREAFISIGIPGDIEIEFLDKIYAGLKTIASEYEFNLLGGDTVKSPDRLIINIALTGEIDEGEILYRNGAKAGDIIFITGIPGLSSAGLDLLRQGRDFVHRDIFLKAHFDPSPQVKEGRLLAASKLANSLIDVSDSLAADLWHICKQSNVGAVMEMAKLPIADELADYCALYNLKAEDFVLHGGEDYILLGTVPEKKSEQLRSRLQSDNCALYPIGRMVEECSLSLRRADSVMARLEPRGHDHFK